MRKWIGGAVAALFLSSAAAAQILDVHAGRLIDPGAARVLTDQRIRIVDGRITAVTPWRDADGPAAVDWSGETVLPGLIDLHTHLADGAIDEHANDPAEPLKHSEAATILRGAAAARSTRWRRTSRCPRRSASGSSTTPPTPATARATCSITAPTSSS